MNSIHLAGQASTQSRARRPLPPGVSAATTVGAHGVREKVIYEFMSTEQPFEDAKKRSYSKTLLSWVGGQAGLLWGAPSKHRLPEEINKEVTEIGYRGHGSYPSLFEQELCHVLGQALDGVFSGDDLSCRFELNGKDPLDAAARVARAVTGRDPVASCGYHGAGEAWVHPPYPLGIPQAYRDLSHRFTWGDVDTLRVRAATCAAVCVEVPALDDEEGIASFLRACRRECDSGGAVFIMDETVTGFRLGLKGAAGRYGVKPDIATYGKALSAVGCTSAIVGVAEMVDYLDGMTFHSLTFGGHPGLCAVATATVSYLMEHERDVYGHLALIGSELKTGLNALGIKTVGQNERSIVQFESNNEWLGFCSDMANADIVLHRPQFPTLVHDLRDVSLTLETAARIIRADRKPVKMAT